MGRRDYWSRFERFVSLLTRTCDDVYIVTGPLYLPSQTPLGYFMQHPMIGASPAVRPSCCLPVTFLSGPNCSTTLWGVIWEASVLCSSQKARFQTLFQEALLDSILWQHSQSRCWVGAPVL